MFGVSIEFDAKKLEGEIFKYMAMNNINTVKCFCSLIGLTYPGLHKMLLNGRMRIKNKSRFDKLGIKIDLTN